MQEAFNEMEEPQKTPKVAIQPCKTCKVDSIEFEVHHLWQLDYWRKGKGRNFHCRSRNFITVCLSRQLAQSTESQTINENVVYHKGKKTKPKQWLDNVTEKDFPFLFYVDALLQSYQYSISSITSRIKRRFVSFIDYWPDASIFLLKFFGFGSVGFLFIISSFFVCFFLLLCFYYFSLLFPREIAISEWRTLRKSTAE